MKPKEVFGVFAGLGILATVFSAFTLETRKEIGKRDRWTCQISGKQFKDGWMLQAAHYPTLHQKEWDDNPENGRMLGTEEHIIEEIQRGNIRGAKLLWQNQSVRTTEWIAHKLGIPKEEVTRDLIREHDEKLPFEEYVYIAGVLLKEA